MTFTMIVHVLDREIIDEARHEDVVPRTVNHEWRRKTPP
jgi:hypothetical protein